MATEPDFILRARALWFFGFAGEEADSSHFLYFWFPVDHVSSSDAALLGARASLRVIMDQKLRFLVEIVVFVVLGALQGQLKG